MVGEMTPGVGLVDGWLIVVICVASIWAVMACYCILDENRLRAKQRRRDADATMTAVADGGDTVDN